MGVHGSTQGDVAVGVETPTELFSLVAEVALDLEYAVLTPFPMEPDAEASGAPVATACGADYWNN